MNDDFHLSVNVSVFCIRFLQVFDMKGSGVHI